MAFKDLFDAKSPFDDLRETVIAYVKQETLAPLKRLVRYLIFGLLGSFMLSIGVIFMQLALLRLLQTQTGTTFRDHLSWAPYLIVVGLSLILILAAFSSARRRASAKELVR